MEHKSFDKLFITDTLHELYNKIGPTMRIIDTENKPSRPRLYKNLKGKISLLEKFNSNYSSSTQKDNDDLLSTYGKRLIFLGDKIKSEISMQDFWLKTVQQIKVQNEIIDNYSTKATRNFFFVTHHNRLKKTIFKSIMDKNDKYNFANCMCIKIYSTTNNSNKRHWNFEIIFKGFPDKKEYKYFNKSKWSTTTKGINYLNLTDITNILDDIYRDESGISNDNLNNVNIFLIRHGNAFHNLPLKLTGKTTKETIRKLPNRTVDSSLTPLGIVQALLLKTFLVKNGHMKRPTRNNFNIFTASILNRSQHTALLLINSKIYKNLKILKNIFMKMAIFRLKRKIENDNKTLDDTIIILSKAGEEMGLTSSYFKNKTNISKLIRKLVSKELSWKSPFIKFLDSIPSKHIDLPEYPQILKIKYLDEKNNPRIKGYIRKEVTQMKTRGGRKKNRKTRKKKYKYKKKYTRKKNKKRKYTKKRK